VGQAQQGQSFVDEFSLLTGADVAASTDMTSGGQAAGNWVLEYQTGEVVSTLDLASIWSGYAATLVSIPSNITIDFAGDGFGETVDHGSNVYTNGDIKITYSAANWFQDTDDGQDGSAGLFAGAFSGTETITIETNSGNEFDFASFFINAFGGGFASVEGFRDGASTGLQTTGTGFGQTDGSFTVLMNDAIFNNVDRVVITSNAGGFFDVFDTFVLNAVPSNAPTLTATGTNPGFTENGSAVDLFSGVTAATNDTGQNFTGATFTVTNVSNGASEILSIEGTSIGLTNGNSGSLANGGNYSVTVVSGTATVTLSGMSRSNAQMGTLIDNITYSNSSDNPGSNSRVVTIASITDSGSNNNTLTPNIASTVSVTPVNDAPTLTATGNNPTYTENGSAVDLFNGVSVNTIETGQTITGMTLTVTNLADGSNEILRIDGTDIALLNGGNGTTAGNGISYSINLSGGTATITLSSAAGLSAAATQTVVDGMSYRNSSDAPSTATRVITLTSITDSGGTANGGVDTTATSITTSVSVVAVNDAPIVTSSGGASSFTEGGGGAVIDSGLTLSDPDNSTLPSATVSISGNFQPGADLLIFINDGSTMGNITASYDAGTGVLTMTSAGAAATLAQWQAALRSVTFSNSSDAPSTASRTVSFVVNDGQDNSTTATKIVSVTAVNDAPQISAPVTIGVTEDVPSTITGISFSDVDAGSANVTATFLISSGTLSATSGGSVTVGGTASALTLTGSIANINSFIAGSNLRFTTAANATANVTLTVNINDGGNTGTGGAQSASETITLQVTAVNDAPIISAPGSIAITEDVPGALTGISFSDVDAGSGNVTVTFSVPSGMLSATSGSGVTIGGTSRALTLTGSLADINTFIAASGVRFTTDANATANVTLGIMIEDGGNTGSGGAQTDSTSVTLVVTAVNDAPVNSLPTTQSVDQDGVLVFSSANGNLISISDVDAGSNHVQVTLTATNGLLTLGSTAGLSFSVGSGNGDGTMTFTGSIADINSALNGMVFSPTSGYNGPASLQSHTNDQGNSGSGGAQTDTDILAINVNSLSPRITEVSSSTANGTYKIGDTITITTTFDQVVTVDTGGGIPTLLLETGLTDRIATYVSGSGSNTLTFSYTVQAGDISADLDYQSTAALSLNGSSIRGLTANDAVLTLPSLGAAGSLGANKALVVDGIRPAATSISLSDTALRIGETATVTITFAERVVGLDTADFTVASGTLTGLSSADGGLTWTATFTPDSNLSDATNVITLDNTGVMDLAGNVGSGTTDSANYAIDTLRPTANIVVTDTVLKAGQSTTVTVTFSEAVTGLTMADFSVANGSLSNLTTSDNITWTATLTPSANVTDTTNLVTLDNTGVQDAAGNLGVGTTDSNNYIIDTQRPTASIVVADSALKAGQTTTVTITFSEAVTGLTTADFNVANGALSNLSSNDGGITWTATLTPSSNVTDPTNLITLDNTGYTDFAGNTGTGTTDSNNYAIDSLRPTATITVADTALSLGETTTVTITFSEPVSGLTVADFTAANGSLSGLSTSDGGLTWTAIFTPSNNVSDATNVITLDNTGYTDSAGNTGTGTTDSANYAIDTLRPTATIQLSDSMLAAGETATVTITFSEAVTGLSLADISASNGTLSGLSSNDGGVTWTAMLTPTANITASSNLITLNTSGVQDAAGNTGIGDTLSDNYVVDTAVPVIGSVSVPAGAPYNAGDTLTFVVNASEAVLVNGTPRLALDIGGTTVFADYIAGSGTATLVFQYSVQPGLNDADGISVTGLQSNGGSLRDATGNAMNLALNNIGDTSGVRIDTTAPTATLVLDQAASNAGNVRYILTFSEDVSGVDLSDFSLARTGNAQGTLSGLVQIDARTYQITISNVVGSGSLALTLNSSGTNINDSAGNALAGGLVGQAYTQNQTEGDPEFRSNPADVSTPETSSPPATTLPSPPAPIFVSPLLPPPLFDVPTIGSGIPTLGNIFINNGTLAPSYIAQVFASSDSGSISGGAVGFLGFGGGDGGVFGTSSFSSMFSKDVPLESGDIQLRWGSSSGNGVGGGEILGAPTLGQQLQEIGESEQRQIRDLAWALGQISLQAPNA
jgi:hypothetical protein